MKNQPLFIFLILIILAFGLILLFKLPNLWSQEKYPISVAVSKTPLSSPFYIAQAINAFDNTCVDVKFTQVLGGQVAFKKVISGETDFGTVSDSVIAFQSLKKYAFVNHAMFVQSSNDVKLITRTSDNIQSILALDNKRIGLTKGTASEYLLSNLLALEGLGMSNVKLKNLKPAQLTQSFSNNNVDAFLAWEPFAFEAYQKLGDKITIQDTKSLSWLSFNLISQSADSQLVEKAKCLIQGLQTAINYIASNPEDSKKIILKALGVTPDFINWVWPDYIFKLSLNQSLLLNIKSQTIWAIEMQLTKSLAPPDVNRFIDTRALLQVDPGAVNITQ